MPADSGSGNARNFLEIMAGVRCPCGHLDRRHRKPDPAFKVGALVEIRWACWDCECRGEIGTPSEAE